MDPTTSRTTKPANRAPKLKKDGTPRAEPKRRDRSPVEAATSKVMNLIGRLSPGEQRKVMNAVQALVSKED